MLGSEGGDARELYVLLAGAQGVADAEDTRIEQAHDVAGVRLVHDRAVIGHHSGAGGQLDLTAALHMVGLHAALELARADADEGDAVAMVLIHVGLDLEDKAGELLAGGLHNLAGKRVHMRRGAGCQAQEVLKERLDAKVGEGGTKEYGRELAGKHRVQVELGVGAVQQLDIVHKVLMVVLADQLVEGGIAQRRLDLLDLLGAVGAAVALKGQNVAAGAIEDAAEIATVADGPVHGVRADAQDVLDLFHKVEGVAGLAVHLVDEREDGNAAQGADAEELLGLCLDALGAVDHHDRGVGGHQGTVGILGEVLVAGGVQNIDAAAAIGELQYGRGNGDAALLLDVHPVGHRVARVLLALDGAGGLDGAGVEQQLLGKGGLAGVRVRDDRERAARGDLVSKRCHGV